MSSSRPDVFSEVYGVVVLGAGYAGFAAALAAQRAGRRVLLMDRRAALLVESGWSFSTQPGTSDEALWQEWHQRIERHTGGQPGNCLGAMAEVLATEWLHREALPVLYYVAPLVAERDEAGLLTAVVLATKGGLRRVRAHRWIDASDDGELATLLSDAWRVPPPRSQTFNLFFRHPRDDSLPARELPPPEGLPCGTCLRWMPSAWPNEYVLSLELPASWTRQRQAWLPALRTLRDFAAEDLVGAVFTHGSVLPAKSYSVRDVPQSAEAPLPANVCFAGASGTTLAEKFASGLGASRRLDDVPAAHVPEGAAHQPVSLPRNATAKCADIAIAGLGTGGAMAAIAAARQGADVFALESMPFPGGVGTGGGIHVYYFGVKGGLQEELDQRVREIMPLFGTAAQVGGFHPEAKKLVLDTMLDEAGVNCCFDAQLATVERIGGAVASTTIATATGPARVQAEVWVDATGDADLAAAAGASFRLGRQGDGLLHAFGQSSGRASVHQGVAKLQIINFDAGFCDPTDPEDLTRARVAGVRTYVQGVYTADARPTYIAPAVGLRQSRHIETDYTLSLDDLIYRRRFPDAVGYTGCHYDNHARDYEFETDDAAFWVWVCQQWYGRLACEMPFGILLPRALDNVLLACRALGVSEEAHHSFRMQRDMQRVGEVAGLAAALAVREHHLPRAVSIRELQRQLLATGALSRIETDDGAFGHSVGPDHFVVTPRQVEAWLAELQGGPATEALWHVYRAKAVAEAAVVALLDSVDTTANWRAAAVLAMWRDVRAEPRLMQAIVAREDDRTQDITRPQQEWFYVPRWYAALTLLKRCITDRSLPLLEELAADPGLVLNLRSAIALAIEAWAQRCTRSRTNQLRARAVVEALLATPAPGAMRDPQAAPLGHGPPPSMPRAVDLRPVLEDYRWQLHLAVGRARLALGLPLHEPARRFLDDERAIVRRAFWRLPAPTPASPELPPSRQAALA